MLDLGGGNGVFADQLIDRFPSSDVTILDISSNLLKKNRPSSRKKLINGSIEYMAEILEGHRFDCIAMNWVLHHLVGESYRGCWENCLYPYRARAGCATAAGGRRTRLAPPGRVPVLS